MEQHTMSFGYEDKARKAAALVQEFASNVRVTSTKYHDFELKFQTTEMIKYLRQMELRQQTQCYAAEFNEECRSEQGEDDQESRSLGLILQNMEGWSEPE